MPKKRHYAGSLGKGEEKVKARMPDDTLPPDSVELFRLLKARRYREAAALVPDIQDINRLDLRKAQMNHWKGKLKPEETEKPIEAIASGKTDREEMATPSTDDTVTGSIK